MNVSSKTPFYTVLLESGKNITYLIEDFRLEDCAEEDDIVQFNIKTGNQSILNEPGLQIGRKIKVRFGYLAGLTSNVWRFEISERSPVINDSLNSFKIVGTALSYVMKKGGDTKGFENKKPSDIIKAIATKNGLKAEIIGLQDTVIEKVNQGSRSDWDFLRDMLKKHPGGPYRMTVKNDKLRVVKLDLAKNPELILLLGGGGNLKSFTPKEKENTKKGDSAGIVVSDNDPKTAKTITPVKVDRGNSGEVSLGLGATMGRSNGQINLFGSKDAGNILTQFKRSDPMISGFQDPKPEVQKAYASNKAQLVALGELEATAVLGFGDPRFKAEMILPVRGVGKLYSGNWYSKKVIHSINKSGGYTGTIELKKNATAVSTGADVPVKNQKNTKPGTGSSPKINVSLYDPAGIFLK